MREYDRPEILLPFETSEVLDRKAILKQYEGYKGLAEELWENFLKEAPEKMAELRNALDAADLGLLGLHAHSMKSASEVIGARLLSRAASELEAAAQDKDSENIRSYFEELERETGRVVEYLSAWR